MRTIVIEVEDYEFEYVTGAAQERSVSLEELAHDAVLEGAAR